MFECTMPQETAVWKRWYGAVSSAIASATDDAYVRDAIMACWSSDSNGWVHMATDEGGFTRPQTTKITGGEIRRLRTQATDIGNLTQQASRPASTLARTGWDCDTDDEVEDLTSDAETAPPAATCSLGCVSTAAGQESFDRDWDGIESSSNLAHTAVRLLHKARQMIDTSRWWTMRWPSNSISLLSRACDIDIDKK